MQHKYKIFLSLALLLLFAPATVAQDNLAENIQILLAQKPKEYIVIDSILRRQKYDTLQMQKLITLSQEADYPQGEIFAYNMLGRVNRMTANYARAITYHQKAYQKAFEIDDKHFEIYSLNMLGVVYRRMDAVKSALEYHYKALEIAQKFEKKDKDITKNIAISHNSIGNIYLLLQREDLAMKHFLKALDIEKGFNNRLGQAINYQNIGSILEQKGDLDKALEYYNKSLVVNNIISSKLGKIICETSISNIFLKKNQPEEALKIMQPIIDLAIKLNNDYYLSDVYIHYGRILKALKRYQEAKTYINKGLAIALDKNILSEKANAYELLSTINEKQGHFKEALQFHKKFTEEKNKIFNKKNRQIVSDLVIKQLKLENNEKIKELDEQNQIVKKKLRFTKIYLYFIIAFVVLLMILGFIFSKQSKLNNQRKIMNIEQNLLRAQMNPHFIFNSLNSIKLFIIQNRQKDAAIFLSKFSKLIRAILNSTIEKETSLDTEIDTISLYISIENSRFMDEIEYKINVDESLDLQKIKIPSLLTQPFIENALWHGLSPKKGEKKLTINIFPKDKTHFTIEIVDNGIGRKRAMEIKKSRTFKRTSIGIDLSKERLAYFSKQFKNTYDLKFIDLEDNEGNPKGTKVIINIPYK
jgi:tetratricopeptide (TPR) repeat protein